MIVIEWSYGDTTSQFHQVDQFHQVEQFQQFHQVEQLQQFNQVDHFHQLNWFQQFYQLVFYFKYNQFKSQNLKVSMFHPSNTTTILPLSSELLPHNSIIELSNSLMQESAIVGKKFILEEKTSVTHLLILTCMGPGTDNPQ